MCGIAGAWAPQPSREALESMVHRMVEALHRRGPDDSGFHLEGHVALGMSRLSIIDVAGGHQPISNEDETITLVCNGEIYNHAELRRQLESAGHRFRTASDVEVILHLYEERGERCLEQVRGMFAVAIWDRRHRRLFIGRDRLGIKPLYYAHTNGGLLFGSEIKALARSGLLSLEPDLAAVDQYFTFGYIPAPLSIYRHIRKLEPGHYLIFDGHKPRIGRYWSLEYRPDNSIPVAQIEERFLSLFRDAVSSHLMSEVPLGAFLSGGVDSGLVVAMMSEASATPVRTFTIGFAGGVGGFLDERGYAREISERYGTVHTELEVEPRIGEVLGDIVDAFDEPFADDSVIPSYYICKLARQHVTVALSGLGGDELFGGYERYLGFKLSLHYDRVPAAIRRRVIAPMVDRLPERADGHYTINHMKRFTRASMLPPAARYREYLSVFPGALKERLFTEEALREMDRARAAADAPPGLADPPRSTWLNEALHFDAMTYLPEDILALSDRLSMWSGLELRVPFLDHPLVEFCATIPDTLKVRGLTKKYLLRRVAAKFLPPSVMNHRKQGFASPMAAWLRADLKDYVRDALSKSRLDRHGLLRPAAVEEMITAHQQRRESYDKQLFAILMFQRWHERFM